MNPDLVPWVTAFCCISLIFVTLATILFCVFAEKYNVHQARSEKGGHLQVTRNLIKLSATNSLEAVPIFLPLKRATAPTQKKIKANKNLLANPILKKQTTVGIIKKSSPVLFYEGKSLIAQTASLKPDSAV